MHAVSMIEIKSFHFLLLYWIKIVLNLLISVERSEAYFLAIGRSLLNRVTEVLLGS